MKELIERNYKSTVKRGLIKPSTTKQDFIDKIYEEVNELEEADNFRENALEMADVILTVLNFAEHYKVDIERVLYQKLEINENRKD